MDHAVGDEKKIHSLNDREVITQIARNGDTVGQLPFGRLASESTAVAHQADFRLLFPQVIQIDIDIFIETLVTD